MRSGWSRLGRRGTLTIQAALFVGLACRPAAATPQFPGPATSPGDIAVTNVNLIPMTTPDVIPAQTVVVRGDRIVAVGPAETVVVRPGTTVIDGNGRFLLPGLVDAHVHLEGDGTLNGSTRPDFGDGPLYLRFGITTVFNLAGTAVHLDWRRRVEAGTLIGPTIYTAGPFINEPRVRTPDEVEREVRRQALEGFDLLKFHELHGPGRTTTSGLKHAAYMRLNEAARAADLPLVGHAPVNLGLDAVLEARQPLAHVGTLSNVYFLPLASNRGWLAATALSAAMLLLLWIPDAAAMLLGRRRDWTASTAATARVHTLIGWTLLVSQLAAVSAALFLPGGPYFDSLALRAAFAALAALSGAAALALVAAAAAVWRNRETTLLARWHAGLAAAAAVTFACTAIVFWWPVARRSTDQAIDDIARRLAAAQVPVQSTLVVYDATGGPGKRRLTQDPAVAYLSPETQARWKPFMRGGPPGYRYPAFMRKVAASLNKAGVRLVAGTDAMGYPLVIPGAALIHELELLVEIGMSPHEAIYAATVAPAALLGRPNEFGTVEPGRRADLILVGANPLDDVGRLRTLTGVMARGRWFSVDALEHRIESLGSTP